MAVSPQPLSQTVPHTWVPRPARLPDLAADLPEALLPATASLARRIVDPALRAGALAAIAARLEGAEQTALFAEALEESSTSVDPDQRVDVLAALLPHVPPHRTRSIAQEAIGVVDSIEEEFWRAEAIAKLAPKAPPILRDALVTIAAEIDRPAWRASALIALLPHVSGEARPNVVARAVRAAGRIREARPCASALLSLVPYLPEPRPPALIRRALAAASEIEDEYWRADALLTVSSWLSRGQIRRAVAEARSLADPGLRAKALLSLAGYLPERHRERVQAEAWEAALSISNEYWRVATLVHPGWAQPDRALAALRQIEDEFLRAEGITALSPALDAGGRAAALTAAREISAGQYRSPALAAVAAWLPTGPREQVMAEAVAAARAAEHPDPNEEARLRAATLSRIGPSLPDSLWEFALAAAWSIEGDYERGQAMVGLARALPADSWPRMVGLARSLPQSWATAATLRDVASLAPEDALGGLLQIAREVADHGTRGEALRGLVPQLPEDERQPSIAECLDSAQAAGNEFVLAQTIADLASHAGPASFPALQRVARGIGRTARRAVALAGLLPFSSDYDRRSLEVEALTAARLSDSHYEQSEAVAALAPHLHADWIPELLTLARRIEPSGRARSLVALAPYVPDSLLDQVVSDVATLDPSDRPAVLAALGPRLSAPATGAECGPAAVLMGVMLGVRGTRTAMQAAIDLARRPSADHWNAEALAALVPWAHVRERSLLAAEALSLGLSLTDQSRRARLLADLVLFLPGRLIPTAARAALALSEPWHRAAALLSLAPRLPEPRREQVLMQAVAAARSLTSAIYRHLRAALLLELAYRFDEPLREDLILEAVSILRVAEADSGMETPTASLSALAGRLRGEYRSRVLHEMRRGDLEQSVPSDTVAMGALRALPDSSRQEAMGQVLAHLDASLASAPTGPTHFHGRAEIGIPRALTWSGTYSWLSGWQPGQMGPGPPEGRQLAAAVEPSSATPPERIVSTGFAPPDKPGEPVGASMPLLTEGSYLFWLEIGAPVLGSIEDRPVPIPTDIPAGATLSVALFGFDDGIRVEPGADVGEVRLEPDGTAVVTGQPTRLDDGLATRELLERRLFFPVRTPEQPGLARLRCHLYYERVLIQSRLIQARVVPRLRPVRRALRSTVDFNVAKTLDPVHLAGIAPHRLSLVLNSNGNGTHTFRFFGSDGAELFKRDATLDGQTLGDFIKMGRGALKWVAWRTEEDWKEGTKSRYDAPQGATDFADDLKRLAIRGYRVYDGIVNQLSGGRDAAEQLATLMATPGGIQIAIKEGAQFIFPVALLYDRDLDDNAETFTLCPAFLAALKATPALQDTDCFKGKCPSLGELTVICPSGFWGYRHSLGMPLSAATAPEPPPVIRFDHGPDLAVGVSTDPLLVERIGHEKAVRTLRDGLNWNYASTRAATLQLLKSTRPHLVYFYCHGGMTKTNAPFIAVGYKEQGITRSNLRAYHIRWDESRPLVFINGCRTTALEPERALEFVSAFVENAHASGVIGTEITVFEPLARNFAEECLRRFLGGEAIGNAVRCARLSLLKRGDPLGLAYIPYVIASLRLVPA